MKCNQHTLSLNNSNAWHDICLTQIKYHVRWEVKLTQALWFFCLFQTCLKFFSDFFLQITRFHLVSFQFVALCFVAQITESLWKVLFMTHFPECSLPQVFLMWYTCIIYIMRSSVLFYVWLIFSMHWWLCSYGNLLPIRDLQQNINLAHLKQTCT